MSIIIVVLLTACMFRPIAGYINFCPGMFAALNDAQNIEVALHELTHALVS